MPLDAGWSEQVVLRDGTEVTLRLLRPEDREALQRAFDRLSEESRYRRFFTAMPKLTRAQLDYLTCVDQVHHVAIAASRQTPEGEEGVGIGRFVELEPGLAEPALAVADEMQGLGLGTMMMERLCRAARERGVERFHVEFLEENRAVLSLLEGVSPQLLEVALDPETGVYRGELPVPEASHSGHGAWIEAMVEALRHLHAAERLGRLKAQRS